jgi:hypothetical protein
MKGISSNRKKLKKEFEEYYFTYLNEDQDENLFSKWFSETQAVA